MSIDRRIAAGDLCIFLPLAVPGVGSWLVNALLQLNQALALPGDAALSGLSPLLLALMGILGVGFAWARLSAAPGMFVSQAIVVKGIAAALFVLAVLRGAPAILLALGTADLMAAILLAIGARRAAIRR